MKTVWLAIGVCVFSVADLHSDSCDCAVGESTPSEVTYNCCSGKDTLSETVTAPITCNNEECGVATGDLLETRCPCEDYDDFSGVNLGGTCSHGRDLSEQIRVRLVKLDGSDSECGNSETGEVPTPGSTETDSEYADRDVTTTFIAFAAAKSSPPSRYVPKGAPTWHVSFGGNASGMFSGRLELDPKRIFNPNLRRLDSSILRFVGSTGNGLDVVYHTTVQTNVLQWFADGSRRRAVVVQRVVDRSRFHGIRANDGYAEFSSPTSFPFRVSFYRNPDVESDTDEDGEYVLADGAAPYVVYEIGYGDTNAHAQAYRVRAIRPCAQDETIELYCDESADGRVSYGLSRGDGMWAREIESEAVADDGHRVVERILGAGEVLRTDVREYGVVGGREVLLSVTRTCGGAERRDVYAYFGDGRRRTHLSPDGLLTAYAYDDKGRRTLERVSSPGLPVSETCFSYEPLGVTPHVPEAVGTVGVGSDTGSADFGTPRVETRYEDGIPVSKTLRFVALDTMNHRIVEEVLLADPSATNLVAEWNSTANVRTYTDYMPKSDCKPCSELPSLVMHEDGTIDRYAYSAGEYEPGPNGTAGVFTDSYCGEGDWFRTVVTHYVAGDVEIPNVTTRDVKIEIRSSKKILLQEQYVCTAPGEYARVSWTATTRDDLGQETRIVKSDGTRIEKSYAGRRLIAMTDAEGLTTTYAYDALGRVVAETKSGGGFRPDTMTTTTYDPEDRVLSRTVASGGLSETETYTYDALGRTIATTDTAGIETRYLYVTDATAGLETRTTIRAFGTDCAVTNTTISYADGRTKETLLNGVVKTAYEYGPNWTKTYEGPAGLDSPRWSCSYEDALGRTICETRPGFRGSLLVTSNEYNTANQLVATRSYAVPVTSSPSPLTFTLICYNSLGQRNLTVSDMNLNSQIDWNDTDRIVSNDTRYVSLNGDWWRETSTWQTRQNGSPALTRVGLTRTRLDKAQGGGNQIHQARFPGQIVISIDAFGNETTVNTLVDRSTHTTTQTTLSPDSSLPAETVARCGLTISSRSPTGVTTTYAYDALGRQIAQTDGRGGRTETVYDAQGRVTRTVDALGAATAYGHDALGRQTSVTDPNGMTVTTAYDAEGHVISQRGATYPVDYTYDEFGNKVAMMCYREEGRGNGDITRWFYDEATGLVTNKVYADGKGPSYTYTPDGKLASRTWARGVVTTYTYDNSGALTNTVYSDDTPTISMVYDRVGNMISAVTDGVCTNLYAYSLTGLCTNEVQNSATIARSYDALGRSTGYTLQASQTPNLPTATVTVSYSYDARGRIASITSETNTFTYSYLLGTDIVDGYTCGNFSRKIEFEPLRNLVAAVTNSYANRVISAFDYTNDAAGRRTAISRSGEAFGDLSGATDSYGYNSRNEVISARRTKNGEIIHGFNEDFEYDPIGNRISSTTYNELGEPKTSQYSANNLNQYTSRTVPGYAAVRGHADADATVTVNEKPTYRYGEYFFGSDEFDNTSSPVNAMLETVAVKPGATEDEPDEIASVTNSIYLAKSPVAYEYDEDGNMTEDARFRYYWNGENRMIRAEEKSAPPGRQPYVIAYAYDHMGRNVVNDGAKFIWDDYNVIVEDAASSNATFNIWGLDLDGTMQGAGGVGGLLAVQKGDAVYLPIYDANGNISEYVSSDGVIVAHYTYSSFGKLLMENDNICFTHRFSTKPYCVKTELVEFEFRKYAPNVGRWCNRDIIEVVPLYCMVYNRLVLEVDLLGAVAASLPSSYYNKYTNPTKAVRRRGQYINPRSKQEHREYCGCVCKKKNPETCKDEYFTTQVRGSLDGCDPCDAPCPSDSIWVAWWHTHGGNDLRYDNENFSQPDKRFSEGYGIDGYLITPGDQFKHYIPGSDIINRGDLYGVR